MQKRVLFLAVSLALILFFLVNKVNHDLSGSLHGNKNLDERIVTKVIDGDTIIVSGGDTVRLLDIDSDEKGYSCYDPAKKYLESLVLNKEVMLEQGIESKDQYKRLLRYVVLKENNLNINVQMVKGGMAVARISEENKYSQTIREAEQYAIQNRMGCKWRDIESSD